MTNAPEVSVPTNDHIAEPRFVISDTDSHSARIDRNVTGPSHGPKRKAPLRKIALICGDLLVLSSLLCIAVAGRIEPHLSIASLWSHSYWFVTLSVLWLSTGRIFRIFDVDQFNNILQTLRATVYTTTVVCFLLLVIPVVTPSLPSRRSEMLQFLLLTHGGMGLWRFIFARSFAQPTFRRRALIIGAGWAGRTIVEAMNRPAAKQTDPYVRKGYQLLGFIDDDLKKQETVVAGLPVLGTHEELVQVVKKYKPDDLILAITHKNALSSQLFQAILGCRELGISVVMMQSLYERLTHQVPLEHSGNNLDVLIPLDRSIMQRFYPVFRETGDIFLAIPGLLLLGLTIPFVWLANRLLSPGPLFYRQQRMGKSGELFEILKFRSMIVDAEKKTGGVWASENDDRITPVGRILRKSRLDELPQFWNVLKGDMSLIGPRPERPCFIESLEREIPFYRLRHAVKPGITGWAQVQFTYGASIHDSFVKLRYDCYYIKNQSVLLDLLILLRTFGIVLGLKGR